ncbi:hypothetical protein LJC26_01500 [Desulfovibrio sp. OttesenSCG-928-O18]|nr:hypothetical protein [Desulfovibrio sp. OttesenSCG-928-O18]
MDGQEADVLVFALAPEDCIEVYELWHEAVRFVAVEENNKKSIYDEVDEPYFPGVSDLKQDLLQQRIATKRLLRHFVSFARGEKPREHLQRIFDRVLHFTYDAPEQQHVDSATRILDLIYEQRGLDYHGKDKVDIGWVYVRPELFAKFCNFFDDAISVNKVAAVIWLFEQGYSHERDVKGLSKELVKRILATHAAAVQDAQSTQSTKNTAKRSSKPAPAPIVVPRILWEGREPVAVVEAMRERKYIDAVISHVLFHWCELTNKTEIGRLLIKDEKESSTYLHHVDKLLKKAASLTIAPD